MGWKSIKTEEPGLAAVAARWVEAGIKTKTLRQHFLLPTEEGKGQLGRVRKRGNGGW